METYLDLLKVALPGITAHDLELPLRDAGIHSLDTVILRDVLENHFGTEIPDERWNRFSTLSETLNYLTNQDTGEAECLTLQQTGTHYREHDIRLPQMANSGLSENWLLKEMGDMHWQMLGKGLDQHTTDITDANGNRLYAAFIRVCYTVSPLGHFTENEKLMLKGAIKRFSDNAYISQIKGGCGDKKLNARLMTNFSARHAKDNTRISNGKPFQPNGNAIELLQDTPHFYTEHRLMKKDMISELNSGGHRFSVTDSVIETTQHCINPHYEINGVGLLYFAAYPMIADECTSKFMKTGLGVTDFDTTYHTTHRDVFYMANCNATDTIKVNLNSMEHLEGNRIRYTASLYRESDNKLMARVLTVKQKQARKAH